MAFGKKLAYIVKVNDVRDIPGADRIQLASVMDYTVVIKKNEYKPGDLGLYVEVGSVLPDGLSPEDKVTYDAMKDGSFFKDNGVISAEEMTAAKAELQKHSKYPYFEFLRDKDFYIKSMKLNKFGVISQGILFKPEDIGLGKVKLGQDFTKELCITEKVEDEEEAGLNRKKDNFIVRYMMRYAWFRALSVSLIVLLRYGTLHSLESLTKKTFRRFTLRCMLNMQMKSGSLLRSWKDKTFQSLFRKRQGMVWKDYKTCRCLFSYS